MLWGGTRALKIDFLGASSFFGSFRALFLHSPNYKSNLNAQFLIFFLDSFSIISQNIKLYLAEEEIRKCLVHFFRIHGDLVTSVWEEFLLDPLQTIELFFSVLCYMIVIWLLLPASTISWTGWWAKTKLKTSKTEVLNQWSVLAKFQKKMVGLQQEEERGEERRTNAGRNTNTHYVFVFVFVYFSVYLYFHFVFVYFFVYLYLYLYIVFWPRFVRFSVGILPRNSVFEPFPVGFFVRLEFFGPVWPPSLIASQWGMYWVNMSLSCAFWVPEKAFLGQKQGLNDPKKVVRPQGDPKRPFFEKIITFP